MNAAVAFIAAGMLIVIILLVDISRSLDIIKRQGGHGKDRRD